MKFSRRMEKFQVSDIQEILKVTARPEIISFGGGLPAPELFPVEGMKKAMEKVLDEAGSRALQYSTTEGLLSLRAKIAERTNRRTGTSLAPGNVIIVTGSQQALDLGGKIFLDEGDVVLCESPTYLGALDALKAYGPRFVEVRTDGEGMVTEDLERKLGSNGKVKLIYVTPDFQNPTGVTWSEERRRSFMEVINEHDIPVIEDNPYGELRFEGVTPPALKSYDKKGNVILLGTFSKILCPGMRVAWICAEEDLLEKFVYVKQASDLHTSTLSQYQIDAFLDMYDLDDHIERLIEVYRHRRDVMLTSMDEFLPEGVGFNRPEGGLFTWAVMPEGVSSRDVLTKAIENHVAFVPGDAFYPNGGHENTMRLNFSNTSPERITRGIQILGKVMESFAG
ncbi:MAG TPA: PLP-dependent aminotransferase family protein [Synergistales bacterium]|nr:PLP-dependent aminotransferase family protein [Synergistales bacterium]